jgi:hypothetical protein
VPAAKQGVVVKNVKQVVLSLMLAVATQALATDGGTPAPASSGSWLPTIHVRVNVELDITPPANPPPTPGRGAARGGEPRKRQPVKEAP